MPNEDTVKLLKECNAGVKTATNAFNEVLPIIKSEKLKNLILNNKEAHEQLGDETHLLLNNYHDAEKDPNPVAKAMSWMKINMKLFPEPKDSDVADLMTDGCNMGVKSLYRYLNQYPTAEGQVKEITKKLIDLEEQLRMQLREFL